MPWKGLSLSSSSKKFQGSTRRQTPRAEDFELPRRSGQHRALLREERHQRRACKEHQWRATLLGAGSRLRVRQVVFEIEAEHA